MDERTCLNTFGTVTFGLDYMRAMIVVQWPNVPLLEAWLSSVPVRYRPDVQRLADELWIRVAKEQWAGPIDPKSTASLADAFVSELNEGLIKEIRPLPMPMPK